MLRIGTVELGTNVLLAPVAGHCDLPFRLVARSCGGVGLAFTDLLCPHGVLKQNRQTQWLMATCEEDQPLGMQLYGQDAALMCEAARWAVDRGAKTIDINMGCPVDKVTKTFAGSMMLCTPGHTVRLAERLVNEMARYASNVPVTAKLRLGFHEGELTAPALARQLVRVGIACITIHGRTAHMRFKGQVDLAGIRAVVEAVREENPQVRGLACGLGGNYVPVIGNGDIRTPFDAQRMVNATGCDGVMIARAALGAPWLLRDAAGLLATGALPQELTLAERIACMGRHFEHLLRWGRDERWAVNRMKQKIGGYGPHLGPSKSMKSAIMGMTGGSQFASILRGFLEEAGDRAGAVPVSWKQRDAIFRSERESIETFH